MTLWVEVTLGYVIITTVTALIGNSIVLYVFSCRWPTQSATTIYILFLAAFDLLCAFVSAPREIMNLYVKRVGLIHTINNDHPGNASSRSSSSSNDSISHNITNTITYTTITTPISLSTIHHHSGNSIFSNTTFTTSSTTTTNIPFDVDVSAVHVYCGISTYLTYLFNLSSAVVLVLIAITRYLKVTQQGQEVQGGWGTQKVKGMCLGLNRVKGARIATAVAFGACVVFSLPTLLFLPRDHNDNGYATCYHSVPEHLRAYTDATHVVFFFVFVITALSLAVLYGRVMCIIRASHYHRHNDSAASSKQRESSQRPGSVLFTEQSCDSFSSLPGHLDLKRQRGRSRTLSESEADVVASPRGTLEFFRSLSSPAEGHVARARANSDLTSNGTLLESETNRFTFFPPVSYSAQMRSLLNLNTEMTTARSEDGQGQDHRLSIGSLQIRKGGNPVRQTTVVFVAITSIYFLSYCPFFVTAFLPYSDGTFTELLSRSYLLSNAANPIVYGLCNPHFRLAVFKCLFCRRVVM